MISSFFLCFFASLLLCFSLLSITWVQKFLHRLPLFACVSLFSVFGCVVLNSLLFNQRRRGRACVDLSSFSPDPLLSPVSETILSKLLLSLSFCSIMEGQFARVPQNIFSRSLSLWSPHRYLKACLYKYLYVSLHCSAPSLVLLSLRFMTVYTPELWPCRQSRNVVVKK